MELRQLVHKLQQAQALLDASDRCSVGVRVVGTVAAEEVLIVDVGLSVDTLGNIIVELHVAPY